MRPNGSEVPLVSTEQGPGFLRPSTPGMNAYTRSHVEAHAGAIMRDEPFTEGVLWINRAPCGAGATSGCEHLLPRMIPTGKRLFVYVMPKGRPGRSPARWSSMGSAAGGGAPRQAEANPAYLPP